MKHLILIIFAFLFSFTTFAQNADINLLKQINIDRNKSFDPSFRFITNSVTPITLAAPVGFITYALIKRDSLSKNNAYIVCSSLIFASVISTALKYSVNRDRPFVTYPAIQQATAAQSPSFPSGHTTEAFAFATSISIAYPKWYIIAPSYLWASAVGYSRMALGVHYPSDVLAGAIIGSASSILTYKLNRWINAQHKRKRLDWHTK